MAGEVYADFALLWLLCHQSRVEAERPAECWLEKWSKAAQEQGTRALDQLCAGVEAAIVALGRGFLSYPGNVPTWQAASRRVECPGLLSPALRLVYRLLFLFVAEDRDLLLDPGAEPVARERYEKYYATDRLRRLAERSARHAACRPLPRPVAGDGETGQRQGLCRAGSARAGQLPLVA